ncbi:MAG: hypothetical protein IZT58_10910 [Actinobacteria bacterium]|nr:hypothetical protein [Actinomycetota bacterium]
MKPLPSVSKRGWVEHLHHRVEVGSTSKMMTAVGGDARAGDPAALWASERPHRHLSARRRRHPVVPDTAAFAVATIRHWWETMGAHAYPNTKRFSR